MAEPQQDETPKGRNDTVAAIYIAGGVPVLVGFIVVLFALARSCNLPA